MSPFPILKIATTVANLPFQREKKSIFHVYTLIKTNWKFFPQKCGVQLVAVKYNSQTNFYSCILIQHLDTKTVKLITKNILGEIMNN